MRVNQLRITPCDIGEANAFVRQMCGVEGCNCVKFTMAAATSPSETLQAEVSA